MADPGEKNFAPFLENVITGDDLAVLISDATVASGLVYSTAEGTLSAKIAGRVSPNFERALANLEVSKSFPQVNAQQEDYFLELKSYLAQMPRVNLTLAFTPRRAFVEDLQRWFSQNLSKRIILNFDVKREIIAGVIVEYNGKYGDFSKSRQLSEVIAKYYENV